MHTYFPLKMRKAAKLPLIPTPLTKFYIGNLVQVYDSASDFNYSAINKLALKWFEPRII